MPPSAAPCAACWCPGGRVFLSGAGAVNVASGASAPSLVTGGVVALVLLPVAVLLRRVVGRLVYGERAYPDRVVSQLRRLEPDLRRRRRRSGRRSPC